jgi:hypothetical protein
MRLAAKVDEQVIQFHRALLASGFYASGCGRDRSSSPT